MLAIILKLAAALVAVLACHASLSFLLRKRNEAHPAASSIATSQQDLDHTMIWKPDYLFSKNDLNPEEISLDINVYVESLCIDSKNFVLNELIPVFESFQGSPVIKNLRVVVFGNAKLDITRTSVTCQHGVAECDANAYEQCALDLYPYPSRYLPFLGCLFSDLPMGHADQVYDSAIFASCARKSALDWDTVSSCRHDAKQSWELQKQAAKATPDYHTYVPWVEINGQHIQEEDDFLTTVCAIYKEQGGSHPSCD